MTRQLASVEMRPVPTPHTAYHVRIVMRAIGFEADSPWTSWRALKRQSLFLEFFLFIFLYN